MSGLPIAAASAALVSASGKPIAVSDSTASLVTNGLLSAGAVVVAAGTAAVVDVAGAEEGATEGAATGAAAGTASIFGLAVSLVTIQTIKSDSEMDKDDTV